jgi:hypothetical protein
MSETFRFEGLTLPYLCQNEGEHIGERRIEVPIARAWMTSGADALSAMAGRSHLVEVGAVMPTWQQVFHEVIDPYDPNLQVTRYDDAERCAFTRWDVLSLSTIEHIGRGEYGEEVIDISKAYRVVAKIVKQASAYLISVPIGYHPHLDEQLRLRNLPARFMRQVNDGNTWEPCAPDWEAQYNAPLPYANVVVFLSNTFDWAEGGRS